MSSTVPYWMQSTRRMGVYPPSRPGQSSEERGKKSPTDKRARTMRRASSRSQRTATDKAAIERGTAYIQLNRVAKSAEPDYDPASSDIWAVYERTLDKFLEDGKLSRKEKKALNKLAKELRKSSEYVEQTSSDATAYAEGVEPAAAEDRGLAIASAIATAAAGVGGAVATAYGQPQLGEALQAAGQSVGLSLSGAQVATAQGQQEAAVAVGQAATALDYSAAEEATAEDSGMAWKVGAGAALVALLGVLAGRSRGGQANAD